MTDRQREYREVYLRSEHWLEVREAALSRAGRRCQVCNRSKNLDVHHRTYERVGREEPGDLTVLCRDCHELFHGQSRVHTVKTRRATSSDTRKNWSRMTDDEQHEFAYGLLLSLAHLGPSTSKAVAQHRSAKTQAVGAGFVALRRRGHVRKLKNRWALTPRGVEFMRRTSAEKTALTQVGAAA